jgi:hypothetical protein
MWVEAGTRHEPPAWANLLLRCKVQLAVSCQLSAAIRRGLIESKDGQTVPTADLPLSAAICRSLAVVAPQLTCGGTTVISVKYC